MQSSHLLDLKDPPRKEGLDFVHKHLSVFIVMLVLLASIFSLLFIKKSSASQVVFYPTTCAGTWNGVQNAIGSPSLADGATLDQFTDQNSAVLGETHGDIYCGQFQGDIPASVHPRTISVHLHLGVDTGSVVHDVVPSVVPPVVPQPDAPSDPSVDTTPVVTPDPTPTQTPAPETVTPAEPAPPDPTAPTVDVIQVPASQPIPEDQTTTPTQTPDPASAQQASLGALFARLVDKKIAAFAPALALDSLDVTPVQFSRPDFLEVRYTTDGTTWKVLGGVTTVNWQDSTFVLNDTAIADWSDLAHLQIGLFSIDGTQVPTSVYLDAMDVSVSYDEPSDALLPTVKVTDPTTPIIVSDKKDFSLNETPTFTIDSSNLSTPEITTLIKDQKAVVVKDDMNVFGEQQIPSVSTALGAFVGGAPIVNMLLSELIHLRFAALALVDMNTAPSVDVAVLSSTGEMTTIPVAVQQVVVDGKDTSQIVVTKPTRMFHPGLYILQVTVHTGEVNVVSEQDFTWGVLALNINKSVYAPGEKVSIQMGVLNAVGHTLCDVDMTLQVIAPSGATQSFATSDNTIEHSVDCHPDAYTDVPDYATHYLIPSEEGTYALVLSATTDSGTRVMYDSFEVRSDAGFSIERTGPTRIYPVASYPITLAVVSDTDWSGSLVERVPAVFEISPLDSADSYNSVVIDGDDKVITWNVSLHKGVLQKFGYQFVAPRISPEFYLLGAAALYASPADGQQVSARPDFQETRQWQIADDAVCTATISGTWNTVNNGSMWTGCTGTGGTPGTADDVTINSSVTVTLGAATPVVNSLTVAGTLDTKSGSNFALNAKTLTVSNTGTLTANGSTITLNGTSDTPFVMNGTFNKGTSLVTFTGTHATTNVQIPALSYYSVTVNKSGETFALVGSTTLDPAGTLTVSNGTFTTSTSNYALSLGFLNISSIVSAIFNANGSTITFTGTTGTLLTKGTNGVLTQGTSTVIVNSDAAVIVCSGALTLNNLTLSPTLTTSRIYTTSANTLTIAGSFNINPSAASALTLTVLLGATTPTTVTGTTTVQGASSATSILSTNSGNQSFTTGLLNVTSAGTFTANGSTITLNGTSDTPFVMNGTFNKGTSLVTFTGTHATTNVQIPALSYYSVTVNKSGETFALVGSTTLDPAGTLTVSNGTFTTSTSNYALSLGFLNISSIVSAIFNANGSTITFTGTTGTLLTKGANGTFTAGTNSTVVIATDASVTFLSSSTTLTFYNLTMNPTITASRVYSTGWTIIVNNNFTINPSAASAATLTVSLGGAVTTTGTIAVQGASSATSILDTTSLNKAVTTVILNVTSAGTFTANGSTVTLNGTTDTPFVMNGTFNQGTSIISFTGTHATTNVQIPALSYYSVTVNKSGETFALTGTTTLDPAGTLNVGNGTVSTTTNNYALSLGYLVLANLATAGFSANNSTVTFTATSGTLITRSSNGSFAAGGSTVVVSSDAAITICSGVISFNNMTLSPALTASRIYTASSSTFTITGNLNINPSAVSALTLTLSLGSTTNVTGTTTVQGTGSATSILDTTSFNRNLTTGLLNIASAGTLTANGSTITLNGTSDTPFVMNGTFNKGTSVVTFTGAHATTSVQIPAISYYSITVNKSGETFTLVGDTTLDPGGTLTVSTGGMTTSTNNYALSLGYMYIANTGTAAFYANNSIVTFTGTSGTLITRFASGGFVQAGSTVVVASASGGVLTLNTVNTTLNALTINTNATLVVLGAALTMSNANSSNSLYIQKGVLSDNGFQITGTTNGTLQIDAGAALCLGENGATNATCNNSTTSTQTSFPTNYTNAHITLSPTSTVYYNSNTDMVVSAIPTYGNLSFLPLLSASRAYSTSAALTVNGNLSVAPNTAAAGAFSLTFTLGATATVSTSKTILIQGGGASPVTATLDTSASNYALSTGAIDIEASGTLNARASTVTVANNWTNNGTFTAGTSTVLLNSSSTATVTGTTTFYKLTITNTTAKEVDFAVSGTPIFTVQNAFTVTGHAEQLIKLFSTSPRTQWQFKPTGTTSVSYANIKDSACQSGANLMTTTSSTNGGNNGTCWGFVSFVSLSISDNTIGFGNLSSIAARYATGDGLGSFTETEAHQVSVATNGISGYSLLISGAPLTYGSSVITAIGNANTASSVGTKQFGLRATVLSGGSGGVQTPYSGSGFAYGATANTTSVFAQQSPSDSLTTVYSVRYLANITPATPSGNYATNVTYILVPNF